MKVCGLQPRFAVLAIVLAARVSCAASSSDDSIGPQEILARLAEEAEVFGENIPNSLTVEILEQRALMPPSRFQPRAPLGSDPPKPRLQVRRIVSEYSVGTFKETASLDLHEFRQVVSVDGRTVRSAESARHALSLGLDAEDDRIRKRMLEDFARHGLVDIAIDYALILLDFGKRGQSNQDIQPGSTANIGAEAALALAWKQKSDAGGQIEFSGRRTVRQPLQGTLWVRQSDGLPLRIEAWAEYTDRKYVVRDQATVDYVRSPHGFLTPVSVVHQHLVDGRVITENLYHYEPFKKFSSDAEIKFTELPDPPSPPKDEPRSRK
jgi:hypothetical protein